MASGSVVTGRIPGPNDRVIDLVDVIKEGTAPPLFKSGNSESEGDIVKAVSRTTERIAREMIPEIAERIIREEIEKLKKQS